MIYAIVDRRFVTGFRMAASLCLLIVVCAGCVSAPPTGDEPAEPQPVAVSGAGEDMSALLRDRRRRDYPDIETDETGFTITEQLRISGEARADYLAALQVLRQGRYEQGIDLLQNIVAAEPEITAPYIGLGVAYERTGDLESAEEALTKALVLAPDHPIAHNELGIVYRESGRFAEARASYEHALSVYPRFHFARLNLGILCDLYLRDAACALENYEAYLEAAGPDREVEIWVADINSSSLAEDTP
jgi:Flp pilus assembly protein TadD